MRFWASFIHDWHFTDLYLVKGQVQQQITYSLQIIATRTKSYFL